MDFKEALKKALGEDMRASPSLCQEVWSALANVVWDYKDESQGSYSCSFRYAGGLISDILGEGDYMDWYCSGPYETVTYKIHSAMLEEGWSPYRYNYEKGATEDRGDPIDPCCDCGRKSDWVYMPAFEGDDNPYFCDECVPRGCSCNHEYTKEVDPNGSDPTEEDGPWKWVDEEKGVWTQVDEQGREFPCAEYWEV